MDAVKITKSRILDLLRRKQTSLSTIPVIVNNILSVASDDNSSASDLARIISHDQAIAAKVLKIANSAYFGLGSQVDTIQRAIVIIGNSEVIGLVVGMNLFSSLSSGERSEGAGGFDMTAMWLHSIGVGFAAKKIEEKVGVFNEESVFLSGILHDVGKIVFHKYFSEDYAPVLERAAEERTPLSFLEKEMLGLDHTEIAGLFMKAWNFPENIIHPVRFHHGFKGSPSSLRKNCMIVHLADFICHQAKIGSSGNESFTENSEILEELGLSDHDLAKLVKTLQEEKPRFESFLNII